MQSANGLRRPLVSVIVPSYNYGHLISETLGCLQSQSYENWECLVIDDGSTDNTESVVAAWVAADSRIRYFRQENQKQAAARNTGLRQSKGAYIQFLDSDDLIEPKKLELHVNYLEQHANVDLIYSGARYFRSEDLNERLLSRQYSMWDDGARWMPETSGRGATLLRLLLRNNIMVVNSPLVRRSLIDAVGLFHVALTPVEDWEYWIRCAATGANFYYDNSEETYALVRAHAESASLDGRRMLRATARMRKAIAALPLDREFHQLNQLMLAEAAGLLGIEEVINGKLGRGIYQMFKAAALDRRPRYRAKWLLCAASAPFVSKERLKAMVTSSVTRSLAKVVGKREG